MNIYLTNDINISATKITVHTVMAVNVTLCVSLPLYRFAANRIHICVERDVKKTRCDRHIQATKTRKLCKPLQKLDAVEWNNFHSTEKCTTPCYMPNTVEWRLQHIIYIYIGIYSVLHTAWHTLNCCWCDWSIKMGTRTWNIFLPSYMMCHIQTILGCFIAWFRIFIIIVITLVI